ncbi:MAG TPA: transglycosylase domain-containing protein [Actinomycetes bacterium]|nr:transglycosylase domain-containing protein [Actinomycetes bacterium]
MSSLRPPSDGGFVSRLVLFVLVSVLCGLLVAGVTLPLVGGLGLAARGGADGFESLPAELTIPPLAERSRILASDGSLIATFYAENRISVPLSEVAPVMRQSIVAIEDSRFYQHGGIDLRGTVRALVNNSSGHDVQGGSTLTQQYVKQVLLESAAEIKDPKKRVAAEHAAVAQSYTRKLRELRYSVALEEKYSKSQILERYLNIAYFGAGAHGIEAAARRYFSTHAADLTLPQAALLAGIVQQPSAFDPLANPQRSLARRNIVLDRMAQVGVASQADVAAAKATPLALKPKLPGNGCEVSKVPFFCDFVLKTIQNDKVFGATRADRTNLLLRGGLTITTTLDPKAQRNAQQALADHVNKTDKVASALVSVQPGTGRIKAMAVSRGYGDGKGQIQFNPATDRAYGGSSGFQAGSTFKPFVAAAALEDGYPFSYPIYAPYHAHIGDVQGCRGTLTDQWDPYNELPSENGTYTLQTGIEGSINTYFAQLEERVGVCRPWQIAKSLGMNRAVGGPLVGPYKTFTLGVDEVSPLSMAEAYATFAARGMHCTSIPILEVTDPTGKRLPVPKAHCQQVLDTKIADGVNELLQGVIERGTGTRAAIGRPAAGKTGTTNSRVSVWFIGYTPDLATAVWAGNPSPPAGGYPLQNISIGGAFYGDVCGGCLPGPIWKQMMENTLAGTPVSSFNSPSSDVTNGSGGTVPSVSGQSVDQAKATLRAAKLDPVVSGSQVYVSYAPAGTVAYSYPGAGATVYPGQRVVIYVSAGPPVQQGGGGGGGPSPNPTDTCGSSHRPGCR